MEAEEDGNEEGIEGKELKKRKDDEEEEEIENQIEENGRWKQRMYE